MSEELPGSLEVAVRTAKQEWPHTIDALEWAKHFCKDFYVFKNTYFGHPARMFQVGPETASENVDVMLGWFASAIMAGFDTASVRWANNPIRMVLHCPWCRHLHVDAPDPSKGWDNPPHKSHLCAKCGAIWRPCDRYTEGVEFALIPKGTNDRPPDEL